MIDYRLATIMLAALLSVRPPLSFAKSPTDFPCAAQHIFPDPIDIRDNQHALAVMRRHPELKSLPGYLDESIEDDYLENTRMPGGRQALVIVVVIDSSDMKTGAATLATAKAAAPHSVEDVGVRIVGGGGVYYLGSEIYSDIDEPVDGAATRGIVRIVAILNPQVAWISLHIDDSYLAMVRRTAKVFGAEACVLWNSRTVPNGSHQISLKAYNDQDLEIPFGGSDVRVLVAN